MCFNLKTVITVKLLKMPVGELHMSLEPIFTTCFLKTFRICALYDTLKKNTDLTDRAEQQ